MNLDEFIYEQQCKLEKFKKYWLENHAKDPEGFPVYFLKDNCGIWYEMFDNFDNDDASWGEE